MNKLQTKMLDLLCEIDEICRKHKIEYCLFAGSGLGADRHGGFIPWDDDADIIMTLDNYEKLLKVFDSEVKEGRALNCLEKDMDYPFTYARYVDVTTTALQRHTTFGGCDPGIKIDIFVAVPTYKKIEKAEKHRLEILAFCELLCPYLAMHEYRPDGYAAVYQKEKTLFDKLGREKYIQKRMPKLKNSRKKGSGKYVLFSAILSNSYILDADILDQVQYVKYEDVELSVSKNNVKFSKALYGDGWISKPQNIEKPHHVYVLDMHKPFGEYLEKLWQEYDFDTARQTMLERRDVRVFEREQFKDVAVNNQKLRNLAVEMEMNRVYSKMPAACRTDWKMLYDTFRNYYSTQLRSNNKNYKLLVQLNEQTFTAAINAAIMMDRYYEAADIMAIAADAGMATDNQLMYRINVCRDITENLYIKKDLDKLRIDLDGMADDLIKDSLTVKIAGLWLDIADGNYNVDDICDTVDQYAGIYGEAGELLAVKGYCLELDGQGTAAAGIYEKAAANVRNGYMYQWLADKGFSTYEYQYE